uniref:Uncharacterized protein n=1 Tax=Rhizophora mucronata TaxID=61149 RepID=A0A2P2PZF7_RHIMU
MYLIIIIICFMF